MKKMDHCQLAIYILCIAIFSTLLLIFHTHKINEFSVPICAFDTIEWYSYQNSIGLIIAPIVSIFTISLIKYDFYPAVILKHRLTTHIWLRQCKGILKLSFITVCIAVFVGSVECFIMGYDIFNWDNTNSYYNMITGHTATQFKAFQIIVTGLIMDTLIVTSSAIFSCLIFWKTNSNILSILFIVAIGLWDGNINYLIPTRWIYYGRVKFQYRLMYNYDELLIRLAVVLLLIVMLISFGLRVASEKEFLNVESI